jgi:hypothetical protein
MYLIYLLPLVNWKALSALVPCIAKAAMINSGIVSETLPSRKRVIKESPTYALMMDKGIL